MSKWDDGELFAASKWEIQCREDYADYLQENCLCECIDDCECLTYEQFEEKKLQDLNDYWDFRDVEEVQEYQA